MSAPATVPAGGAFTPAMVSGVIMDNVTKAVTDIVTTAVDAKTTAKVQELVTAAITALPPAATPSQVQTLVITKFNELHPAGVHLTVPQVQTIVDETIAKLPPAGGGGSSVPIRFFQCVSSRYSIQPDLVEGPNNEGATYWDAIITPVGDSRQWNITSGDWPNPVDDDLSVFPWSGTYEVTISFEIWPILSVQEFWKPKRGNYAGLEGIYFKFHHWGQFCPNWGSMGPAREAAGFHSETFIGTATAGGKLEYTVRGEGQYVIMNEKFFVKYLGSEKVAMKSNHGTPVEM